MMDWRPYFPFPKVRSSQVKALDFAVQSFAETNDTLIESPTGTGKGPIALALARMFAALGRQTYLSTINLDLEAQYIKDFSRLDLEQLHAKKHYPCPNCEWCSIGSVGNRCKAQICSYEVARNAFFNGQFGVSNASFLLTNARFVKSFPQRHLAIFDEAHDLETKISDSYSFTIFVDEIEYWPDEDREPAWLAGHYSFRLDVRIREVEELLYRMKDEDPDLERLTEKFETLKRKKQNLQKLLLDDPQEWVFDQQPDRLRISPLWATNVAPALLSRIGQKRVYMSATLPGLKLQAQLLGIDPAKARFLSLDSPFPVQNRLIHVIPIIRWEYGNPGPAIQRLAEAVQKILRLHPRDRGIIHLSSYRQAADLIALCPNRRLVTHANNREKARALQLLFDTPGTVFVSPSSHEGLDLYDDRCRFQVVAKLPYAFLGDKRIKRRQEANQDWYTLNCAQKLVQAPGRGVRSETDYAVTYILDRGFRYTQQKNGRETEGGFFARAHQFFPTYFLAALPQNEVDL